jgi:branched-chain amino acid transport system permease protein
VLVARENLYGDLVVTVSPWLAFLVALLLAGTIALLVGWPALRLKGHYLAMATLGFGLIVYRIVLGTEFMGGADGITGVPPWPLLPGITISGRRAYRVANYYVAWGLVLAVLCVLLNVVRSRVGRALRSIHGGELAANTMGVNTAGYKLQAFVLSAMLAAGAGCFLTHYNGGIGPSESGALKSVRYVALVAAGGMANLWGVLVISTALNFLSLRGCFGTMDHAFFGAILIAIVSLAPEGPLKPIGLWIRRLFKRGEPGGAAVLDEGNAHGSA